MGGQWGGVYTNYTKPANSRLSFPAPTQPLTFWLLSVYSVAFKKKLSHLQAFHWYCTTSKAYNNVKHATTGLGLLAKTSHSHDL